MNYPTFLNQIDRLTNQCDAEKLRKFVHELARKLAEEKRLVFLKTLNEICAGSEGAAIHGNPDEEELQKQAEEMLEVLEEIQDGERELGCEYNEEYDDWYHPDEPEFVFVDPDAILEDLAKAAALLHRCLDQEAYPQGALLARRLSELTVLVSGDYDEDPLGLSELDSYECLPFDLAKTTREAVYLICMGTAEPDRAESMLSVMERFGAHSISLEDILKMGSKELDLDAFLPSWIEALARRSGPNIERLLAEAQSLLQDPSAAMEYASRYAESHPVLFRAVMENGITGGSAAEFIEIGLCAMKKVPVHHPARSAIALCTAKHSLEEQHRQTAEYCWLEAFRSLPTVESFLRLRLQTEQWADHEQKARLIYENYYANRPSWEQKTNAALLFFDGRFDELLDRFMSPREGIGWSGTFMKEGIALMLLLLDFGTVADTGLRTMKGLAVDVFSFDKDSYCGEIDLTSVSDRNAYFWDRFQAWKAQTPVTEGLCKSWLEKLDGWIALRVAAIMDKNKRNYYDECASFVAALGEVLESRGSAGEKERIMQRYKAEYFRRRAFHDALRQYGMRK